MDRYRWKVTNGGMIVSRASECSVIANAIRYATQLVRGKVFEVAKAEFAAVNKAGFKDILNAYKTVAKPAAAEEEVKEPSEGDHVTAIDPRYQSMDLGGCRKSTLEDQYLCRERNGLYRPIIRVSDANLAKAEEELEKAGYNN